MALKDEIPELLTWIQDNQPRLDHSFDLLCIYEGDLLKFIEQMFRAEMGTQTFEAVLPRIPPINFLRKIVDKLATIYQQKPMRLVENSEDEEDQALLDFYVDLFDMDTNWNQGNEFLSLDKINLMQPFFNTATGKPDCRAISNDKFLPFSRDVIDPTTPTHIMTKMQTMRKKSKGQDSNRFGVKRGEFFQVDIWWAYTDEEFIIFDTDGELRVDLMEEVGNPDGVNVFGEIPFTYINSSKNFLLPPKDSDTKRMSVLIPALLGDLNYAAKFQSFSQIFAFNIDKEKWTIAPNSVHFADDKPNAEGQARVQVVKPEVDIPQVVGLITAELNMWIDSKGIKPGSVGNVSNDNMSGIAKAIDEGDASSIREKSASLYSREETGFWDLVLNKMHPFWVANNLVPNRHIFSEGARVVTTFPEQRPLISRKDLVETVILEMTNSLESRIRGIMRLNPNMTKDEAEELAAEIDEANTITIGDDDATPRTEEAKAKAHTHQTKAGKTPLDNDLGNNQHDHGPKWSSTAYGEGHTHTNKETGEVSGPPS